MLGKELSEASNNLLGLAQPAVLGKNGKQVLGDLRDSVLLAALELGVQRGKTLGPIGARKSRVVDECGDFGRGLDSVGERCELGADLGHRLGRLGEGCSERRLCILASEGRGRTTTERGGTREDTGGGVEEHFGNRKTQRPNSTGVTGSSVGTLYRGVLVINGLQAILSLRPATIIMFLLAWLRVSLFSTFIAAVAALPQEALFTSSVTYCNPPETLLVQRFEVAFFPANTSVSFNVSVSSVQPNVNVSANLFLNVYGLSPVNITIDLCTLFDGQLCPLPMYNFTGADSIPLPDSLEVAKKLPAIAFKIPDLEGFAQLTLRDAKTGAIRACVQTTIDNGRSINQPAVKWATFSVAAFALVASIWHSTLSPSAHIPARLMDIMSLSQTIAASSMLNLNYPSVYRAFALNFGWAFGLVSSEASPIQRAIDSMRRRTGGHGQPKGGSALDFVNRKLSPYNDVTAQMLQLSRRANVGVRQTVKGEVQTVTDDSSNVLQAGVPIYVNSLFISTTNAFMTIFIVALIVLAITLALFSVGYAAHYLAKRRSKGFVRGLDYLSYVKAWTLRIVCALVFLHCPDLIPYRLLSSASHWSPSHFISGPSKIHGYPFFFPLLPFFSSSFHWVFRFSERFKPARLMESMPSMILHQRSCIPMHRSTPIGVQRDFTSSLWISEPFSSAPS